MEDFTETSSDFIGTDLTLLELGPFWTYVINYFDKLWFTITEHDLLRSWLWLISRPTRLCKILSSNNYSYAYGLSNLFDEL